MHFVSFLVVLLLCYTSGEGTQPMKVLFFGDSVISGIHNIEAEVCPFRYDFLRSLEGAGKKVTVVGTNTDKEGVCQKTDEGLSLRNNGYQHAKIDDLLDYIMADLEYLDDPVDYVFTSIGLQDCLQWHGGKDYQILSQSVRRIMGRLLNLNENAIIYHIPLMLPPSANKESVDCMDFVNQKLRDVYDPEKNGRIRITNPLGGKTPTDSMFYKLGGKKDELTKAVASPAVNPPLASPETTDPESRRRLKQPLEYLPTQELSMMIAKELMTTLDWEFRAQTPTPTMEVTKEEEYYGYTWCKDKYEEDECFEYYYGYVWCLQKYSEDQCYNYYYGDKEEWDEDDNYKWCLNFYDEEYCSFAYQGKEPDTWDWLSFGYHDCLKTSDSSTCFEQYYGYAWCVNEYSDSDCYEYYYGNDEWEWTEESNYKWCINFYTPDECKLKYVSTVATNPQQTEKVDYLLGYSPKTVGLIAVGTVGVFLFLCYKKINCFGKKEYSRLDTRYVGGDDEVGGLL